MKSLIAVVLLAFVSFNLLASDEIVWYKGVLVLNGNEVLNGDLSPELSHDAVLFKQGDKVTVYPAYKIAFFQIYDPETKMDRSFMTVKMEIGAAKQYQLYEVLVNGEIRVLRKQNLTVYHVARLQVEEYSYFVQWDNELMTFYKFKRKVYPKMLKLYGEEIKNFQKENRLDPRHSADAMEIIEFFNQQASSNAMASRF